MEEPKCKICGKRHYGLCDGFGVDEKLIVSPVEESSRSDDDLLRVAKKSRDWKRRYMKEYMRRRRALGKSK